MAATQAEKQQNDVNSEKVQSDQHLNLRNTLLQNGTEKSGVRGGSGGSVVVTKTKASGTSAKNLGGGIEMSQYRQDGGPGSCPAPQSINEQGINSGTGLDSDLNQNSDVNSYPPVSESAAGGDATSAMHTYGFPFGGGGVCGGRAGGGGGGYPQQHGPTDQHTNSQQQNTGSEGSGGLLQGFGQFGPQAIRHGFPGSKQPMIGPRPPSVPGGPSPFAQQQRFMSGQSISQPTGPTPTLNQLLQSSNPMHRYQNSYGEQGPYGQSWPSQKSISSYSPQGLVSGPAAPVPGYRNQAGLSSAYSGPPPNSPGGYEQQSAPPQQGQQHAPPRQGWGGQPPPPQQPPPQSQHHPPSSPGGAVGSRQSPQPGSHSPGPGMPPSPQQQPPPPPPGPAVGSQVQPFPARPAQPTTPNAHAPDTGDLTGQNSNDSSSGPAPGTPNSQGMRPTPSPTGSTGSRSMSPAVGQQNIQMPPRPSSSQSDGSGPTRLSHSPMTTQGGYQQHLGPPPHMHGGYKMTSHPGMVPSSSGQQMLYSSPGQQYQQQTGGPVYPGAGGGRSQTNMQYSTSNQAYGPPGSGAVQQQQQQQQPQQQQGSVANSMSGGTATGQYPGRPMPNHVPHPQFSAYQQSWSSSGPNMSPASCPPGGGASKIGSVSSQTTTVSANSVGPGSVSGGGPPRPPHYLKQHLQHKMAFGSGGTGSTAGSGLPPSPGGAGGTPGQGYSTQSPGSTPGMGPPIHQHGGLPMGPPSSGHHHQGMGPPASMGPPNMAPPSSSGTAVTTSGPPLIMSNSHDGPMPPPSSTPNSHSPMVSMQPMQPMHSLSHSSSDAGSDMLDNGITTTAAANMITHVTSAAGGSVTSVVTTGPDGTTLDEGSQQSTLSNASAASGEDPQCTTPKSRKNELAGGGHYSHPATPQSTVPSPGAASMNSIHEEYDMSSPSWPRTPASPVFNTHVPPPDTYRSKKTDSLGKLYEMDDSPDRRVWLDKLLAFMEERRTPITTCPTISKNPLDLFRLYMYVKERGGFMEVTKNKTWKDIAGMLGIGASSSAAYTLRKHYTKNLLAYECQFDRGGIDPQPIINQVEASSKKKGAKAASVPSPGSSNSQDSFPAPGSSGASMDGYGGYGYPPGNTPDYNSPPMQRPSSQSNAPSPHAGAGVVANHHGGAAAGGPTPAAGAADNVNVSNPFDDVSPSPPPRPPAGTQYTQPYGQSGPPRPQGIQQGYGAQTSYNQYPGPGPGTSPDQYQTYPTNTGYPPATRPMYPPYGPDTERNYNQATSNNTSVSVPPISQGSTQGNNPDHYNRYSMSSSNYTAPRPAYCAPPGAPPAGPTTSQPPSGPYTSQQDYYRAEQAYPGQQQGPPPVSGPPGQLYPNGPPSKTMPPPAPQPRRHPDFTKDQQSYQPYTQQRPQIYGWQNSQYRGQYQTPNAGPSSPQQWNQVGNRTGVPSHNNQNMNNQWEHRYPSSGQQSYQPGPVQQGGQQWSPMPTPGIGQSSPLRAPLGPRSNFRSDGKPFNMLPPQGMKSNQSGTGVSSSSYPQQPLPKREISFPPDSVEATLPVLYRRKRICKMDLGTVDAWKIMMSLRSGLLAETSYALDVLNVLLFDDSTVPYFGLNHWPGMLDLLLEHFRKSLGDMFDTPILNEPNNEWYQTEKPDKPCTVDLGAANLCSQTDSSDHQVLLHKTPNYTHMSRKGQPVRLIEKNEDIFICDNHKDWDVDGDASGVSIMSTVVNDPWQLGNTDPTSTKYILPCFQSEFNSIPFCKLLEEKGSDERQVNNHVGFIVDKQQDRVPSAMGPCSEYENGASEVVSAVEDIDKSTGQGDVYKNCDKKKRTKTLSDVISRIKKNTSEVHNALLTHDLKENVKTENADGIERIDLMNASDDDTTNLPKTEEDCEIGDNPVDNGEPSRCTDHMVLVSGASLHIKDVAATLKRRRMSDYEDECYTRDEASLCLITDSQDAIAKRCVCVSNILRNLTFIPGNEAEFAKNATFLSLVGKLLLLHHEHPVRTHKTRNYDREEDADFADSCSSLQGESEWWWDFLVQIRENVLVSCANIAGHMNLSQYDEIIARPVLDGLLHWAVCPSAHGQDPFANVGPNSLLSPQRLALESLCKMCVTDANVDLVIATPPFSRLERLCAVLTKHLCRSEDQVLREFSVNLLHYLAAADSAMARVVAMQSPCVSLLVAFIEQAEQSALGVANQHGIGALRENPDSMGTSLDMLRRAAGTLLHLAKHPENRPLFLQQEQRLLHLVMSQILDQQVAFVIARVLFHISRTNENSPRSDSS